MSMQSARQNQDMCIDQVKQKQNLSQFENIEPSTLLTSFTSHQGLMSIPDTNNNITQLQSSDSIFIQQQKYDYQNANTSLIKTESFNILQQSMPRIQKSQSSSESLFIHTYSQEIQVSKGQMQNCQQSILQQQRQYFPNNKNKLTISKILQISHLPTKQSKDIFTTNGNYQQSNYSNASLTINNEKGELNQVNTIMNIPQQTSFCNQIEKNDVQQSPSQQIIINALKKKSEQEQLRQSIEKIKQLQDKVNRLSEMNKQLQKTIYLPIRVLVSAIIGLGSGGAAWAIKKDKLLSIVVGIGGIIAALMLSS